MFFYDTHVVCSQADRAVSQSVRGAYHNRHGQRGRGATTTRHKSRDEPRVGSQHTEISRGGTDASRGALSLSLSFSRSLSLSLFGLGIADILAESRESEAAESKECAFWSYAQRANTGEFESKGCVGHSWRGYGWHMIVGEDVSCCSVIANVLCPTASGAASGDVSACARVVHSLIFFVFFAIVILPSNRLVGDW